MSDGFSWWSAAETLSGVLAGAAVSYFALGFIDGKKKKLKEKDLRKRFFNEIDIMKEEMERDLLAVVDCIENSSMTEDSVKLRSPVFGVFEFKHVKSAYEDFSEFMSGHQRRWYTILIRSFEKDRMDGDEIYRLDLEFYRDSDLKAKKLYLGKIQTKLYKIQTSIIFALHNLKNIRKDKEIEGFVDEDKDKIINELKRKRGTTR